MLRCSRRPTVSRAKEEYVVKPPRKPIASAIRKRESICPRDAKIAIKSPIANEPSRFTDNVPSGSCVLAPKADATQEPRK